MQSGKDTYAGLVTTARYRFEIPDYQRDYSWEKDQLQDLWRDLHTVLTTEKSHYFGTILLREKDDERHVYDIIDGQQRMTTLQILINEIALCWERLAEETKATNLRRDYISPGEGYKITLKGEDETFFKQRILGGQDWNTDPALPDDSDSKENLVKAKEFFETELDSKRDELPEGIASFSDYLSELQRTIDQLELMIYRVDSAAEAVRIFQVTNDRGIQLTDLERTKSFLMHQLHLSISEQDEEELEERLLEIREDFKAMYKIIHHLSEHRGRDLGEDQIQQYHFIVWDEQWTRGRSPRYSDYLPALKEVFRGMPNDKDKCRKIREYSRELRSSFEAIKELQSGVEEDSIEKQLRGIFSLDLVGNFYPLLVSAWLKYKEGEWSESDFEQLIRRVEIFTFRTYVLIDAQTNYKRKNFYELARDIHQKNKTSMEAIEGIEELIDRYCNDESVRNNIDANNAKFYNYLSNSQIRYLLYHYDLHLSDRSDHLHLKLEETINQEYDEFDIWIEHIWPKDPSKLELSDENIETKHKTNKHRLGNLALMTGSKNAAEGNTPFDKKRDTYLDSRILMLNEVADPSMRREWGKEEWADDEWGVEQIETRDQKIIDFIIDNWPNQLSQDETGENIIQSVDSLPR